MRRGSPHYPLAPATDTVGTAVPGKAAVTEGGRVFNRRPARRLRAAADGTDTRANLKEAIARRSRNSPSDAGNPHDAAARSMSERSERHGYTTALSRTNWLRSPTPRSAAPGRPPARGNKSIARQVHARPGGQMALEVPEPRHPLVLDRQNPEGSSDANNSKHHTRARRSAQTTKPQADPSALHFGVTRSRGSRPRPSPTGREEPHRGPTPAHDGSTRSQTAEPKSQEPTQANNNA